MRMEGLVVAAVVAGEDVEVVADIPEDMEADFLVVAERLPVQDIEGVIAGGTEVVTAADTEEVTPAGIAGVMLRGIITEDTTIREDIMGVTAGTTIEVMPHMEQPSGFLSVG